jgi:hypothetical protein
MRGAIARPGAVLQVIGVARDLQYRSLDFGAIPFVYVPYRQHYQPQMTLIIRSGVGRSVAGEGRRLLASMNAALGLAPVRPLEEAVAVALTPQRVGASPPEAWASWVCCSRGSACTE